jgi:hypothetical protein
MGIELLVGVYFKVESQDAELRARDELTRQIIKQARGLGVEFGWGAGPTPGATIAGGTLAETRGRVDAGHQVPPPAHRGFYPARVDAAQQRRDA